MCEHHRYTPTTTQSSVNNLRNTQKITEQTNNSEKENGGKTQKTLRQEYEKALSQIIKGGLIESQEKKGVKAFINKITSRKNAKEIVELTKKYLLMGLKFDE